MRGLFTLTFEIDGVDEDKIRAAGLDLRHNFDRAAAQRTPGFRKGLFMCAMDGAPNNVATADKNDDADPERLFDE